MRPQDKLSRAVTAATLCTLALACARSGFDEILLEQGEPVPWHDVGGGPAAARQASSLGWSQAPVALALDSQGRAVVAFSDGTVLGTVSVRRRNETQWEDLGSPGTGVGMVTIAVDAQDRPWVAWSDYAYPASALVMFWNESDWQTVENITTGGAIPAAGYVLPALTFDSAGRAVVAVGSSGNGDRLCVYRRELDAWQLLVAPTEPCFPSEDQRPALAAGAAGSILIAYANPGHVWYSEWILDAWVSELVDPEFSVTSSAWPAVAVTDSGPSVAWTRDSRILLRQRSSGAWDERAGSATGAGLGAASSYLSSAALATGPNGEPVVAWSDGTILFLRYWTGSAWNEAFGSATVGIYRATIIGTRPAIAVRDRAACVAFTAGSDTEFDVYVRCATPGW